MYAGWKRSVASARQHAPRWPLITTLLTLALLATAVAQPTGEDWFTLVATGTATDVRAAIDAGADALERDADGWTTIAVAAAMNPDPSVIEILLAAGADPNERIGDAESTPLMVAARSTPNVEVVRTLITSGADVHARTTRGSTVLHATAEWAPYSHARPYLLDTHTVDTTTIDGDLVTLSAEFTSETGIFRATLYLVAEYDDQDDFEYEWTSRIASVSDDGMTLRLTDGLFPGETVRLDQVTLTTPRTVWPTTSEGTTAAEIGQLLTDAGADPSAHNDRGVTALHHAAWELGSADYMRVLLASGADVNARDQLNSTPIMSTGLRENLEALQVLVEFGVDANARDATGRTTLMIAAQGATDPEFLRALVEAGADVNARDSRGRTALMTAAWSTTSTHAIQVLINAGADVNARGEFGWTALMRAASNANPDVLHLLIAAGANIDERDELGSRALDRAASMNQDPAAVLALLAAGADANARDEHGRTALKWAAQNENPAVLQALIDAGADVNARSTNAAAGGVTALMDAARLSTNPAVLVTLLNAGASVNARDTVGATALMRAARHNDNPATLRVLLDAGADINARNNFGETALMLAAHRNRNPAVLNALLDGGADATIVDNSGRRAIDYARENEHLHGTDAFWRLHDASFD